MTKKIARPRLDTDTMTWVVEVKLNEVNAIMGDIESGVAYTYKTKGEAIQWIKSKSAKLELGKEETMDVGDARRLTKIHNGMMKSFGLTKSEVVEIVMAYNKAIERMLKESEEC